MSDYKREEDAHVSYVYYLVDEIHGRKYTVDGSSNSVRMIEYLPTFEERKLRCTSTP